MSRIGKSIETESRLVFDRGWTRVEGAWGFFGGWWKCSKSDCGDGCTTLWIYKNHWIIYFKWVKFMIYELYVNKDVKKKLLVSKQQQLFCSWIHNLSRPPLGELTYTPLGIPWGGSEVGAGIFWRLLLSHVWRLKLAVGWGSSGGLAAGTPTLCMWPGTLPSTVSGFQGQASCKSGDRSEAFLLWSTSESHTLSLSPHSIC